MTFDDDANRNPFRKQVLLRNVFLWGCLGLFIVGALAMQGWSRSEALAELAEEPSRAPGISARLPEGWQVAAGYTEPIITANAPMSDEAPPTLLDVRVYTLEEELSVSNAVRRVNMATMQGGLYREEMVAPRTIYAGGRSWQISRWALMLNIGGRKGQVGARDVAATEVQTPGGQTRLVLITLDHGDDVGGQSLLRAVASTVELDD